MGDNLVIHIKGNTMELKPQEKIKIVIEAVEAMYLYDVLIRYLTFKGVTDWDEWYIQEDGSITHTIETQHLDEAGRHYTEETEVEMNEAELDDFLEYAKQLAK